MSPFRVLDGPRRKRPCPRCKRVLMRPWVAHRRVDHRGRPLRDETCKGSWEPGEMHAKTVYARATHVLGRLAIGGYWPDLLEAAGAVLKARGEKF